jgi:hypothetical protein
VWLVAAVTTAFAAAEVGALWAPVALAQNTPQITADAQQAVRGQTIREYADVSGQPLHLFHSFTVIVRRPDRLAVDVTGDDGIARIVYDGKQLTLYRAEANKYATIPATGSIGDMLRTAASRLGVDFPLADLLAEGPGTGFLDGITSGRVVGNTNIGGVPCLHLFFIRSPGIELELWVQSREPTVPRRLIATYRPLPGEPRFIAEMGDWKLGLHPPDSDFEARLPSGATKVEIERKNP